MRACFIVIGVLLFGVQVLAAQGSVSSPYVACREATATDPRCLSEEQHRVWLCGDVLLIQLEDPPLVRFGRTKRHAQPRTLAVVRFSTGHYFVFAGEELFELMVEKTLGGAGGNNPVTRGDNQPVVSVTHILVDNIRLPGCVWRTPLIQVISRGGLLLQRMP
jgi:hypothetical protein